MFTHPRSLVLAFALVLTAGIAVIFIGHFGARTTVPIWPTIVVIVLMLAYGGAIYQHSKTEFASPDDGDTFYYLGFIYTLSTLVAALMPFLFQAEGAAELSQKRVLGVFGIGLITTFIGLSGRILFSQFLRGRTSTVDGATQDVAASLIALSRRIDSGGQEFALVVRSMQDDLKAAVQEASTAIRSAASTLSQQITTELTEPLSRSAKEVDKAGRDLGTAIRTANEVIAAQTETLGESLEGLKQSIVDHRKNIDKQLPSLASTAQKMAEQIERWAQDNERISTEHARYEKTLSAATDSISRHSSGVSAAIEAVGKGASHANATLVTVTERSATSLEAITTAATRSAHALLQADAAISRLAASLVQIEKIAAEAGALASGGGQAVKEIAEQMRANVKESAAAVTQVHGSLVEMTGRLVSELRK